MSREAAARLAARFISFGRGGFDLGLVALPTPADQQWLMDSVERRLTPLSLRIRRLRAEKLARGPLDVLGDVLGDGDGADAIMVFGLSPAHAELCRQLNLHRDRLAERVAVPWLVIGHPAGIRTLADQAPDFVDFASFREVVGSTDKTEGRTSDIQPIAGEWTLTGDPVRDRMWLEGRWDELVALFRQDLEADGSDREALLHLAGLLRQQGQVAEAEELLEEVLELAREAGDTVRMAGATIEVARLKSLRGQNDEALALHEEALQHFRNLDDKHAAAVALGEIARIKKSQGQVEEALDLHRQQMADFQDLGDKRSKAVALGDIARVRESQGQVDEALSLHQQALADFRDLGDKREAAVALGAIARIMYSQGKIDEALDLHKQQLAALRDLGDKRQAAAALGGIARIKRSQGKIDEALDLHKQRLAAFRGLGARHDEASTLGDIALIHITTGETDEALALSKQKLEIMRALGDLDGIASAFWLIGALKLQQDEDEEAVEGLEESFKLNQQLGRSDGIAVVGENYARALLKTGDRQRAAEVLATIAPVARTLGWTEEADRFAAAARQLAGDSEAGHASQVSGSTSETALALAQLGDTASATALLDGLHSEDRLDLKGQLLLAWLRLQEGEADAAIELLRPAWDERHHHPHPVQITLGGLAAQALLATGDALNGLRVLATIAQLPDGREPATDLLRQLPLPDPDEVPPDAEVLAGHLHALAAAIHGDPDAAHDALSTLLKLDDLPEGARAALSTDLNRLRSDGD